MNIGILVNTDKHLDGIIGIVNAAVTKGHRVTIFIMDAGARLFGYPSFTGLCTLNGVSMSFCDHSAKGKGVKTEGLPVGITCGSQYNHAVLIHESDKVIVL